MQERYHNFKLQKVTMTNKVLKKNLTVLFTSQINQDIFKQKHNKNKKK